MRLIDFDIDSSEEKKVFKELLDKYLKEIFEENDVIISEDLVNQGLVEIIGNLESDLRIWVYLCYEGEKAIGFVIAQIDEIGAQWCLKPGYGLIREFYITPEYRRKGLGKEMYLFMEEILRKEAVKIIYLTTDTAVGIGFWQSQGYKFTGEICSLNNSGVFEKAL